MIFNIFSQLEYINKYMLLEAGDILMTGTPAGSAFVKKGDHLEATLAYENHVLAKIDDVIQGQ
jgi:2-keto-4-pentenoate hydratase/2-oxohepta-3-ene-1,7-dioic acid hydratase in catechol pathway